MARPPFIPTETDRKLVRAFSAFGIPQEVIRHQIRQPGGNPISLGTLRTRFADELRDGKAKLVADAGNWIVTHMRGDKALGIKPTLQAAQFILETQGKEWGWAKRSEFTGAEGLPLSPGGYDLTRLSEDEIHELKRLTQKAAGATSGA